MSKIQILPEALINKIAAGEVVERPASVVKELVENSLDAGADQILVVIKNGGKDFISVLDNGSGMSRDDALLAIERHATSKIVSDDDLMNIHTMGFRGEALAAVASVSRLELTTCEREEVGGFQVVVEGGKIKHSARIGFPRGARVVVENMFFNTPVRKKFMKSVNTEYNHVHQLILRLALSYPQVQFRLVHNKNQSLNIPKQDNLGQRLEYCMGSRIYGDLLECRHKESYLSFEGFVSIPSRVSSSRRRQYIFINNRYVKCPVVTRSIYEGYKTMLMKNSHPMFFLKIEMPPEEVDVNVHPAKTEVRLKNPQLAHTILSGQISQALAKSGKRFFSSGPGAEKSFAPKPPVSKPSDGKIYDEPGEQMAFFANSSVIDPPSRSDSSSFQTAEHKPRPAGKPEKETPPDKFRQSGQQEKPAAPDKNLAPKTEKESVVMESSENTDISLGYEIIGQLAGKYIMAQGENGLIIIDQHAAHERIRFEEIKKEFYSRSLDIQPLLIPLVMELPPQDGLLLEQQREAWEKLGFKIEHFGGNDYSVKEAPMMLKDGDIPGVIREVLDEMSQFGKSGRVEEFYDQAFERMACHSSVRAGQSLSVQEMRALLSQLISFKIPPFCPHGRPALIEVSFKELDKRFKRT